MSQCKLFGLFMWHNDVPVTGNVLNLQNIVEPRKQFGDYQMGDIVKTRCPGFGINEAVVGMIGDQNTKKEMESILKGAEFSLLVQKLVKEGQSSNSSLKGLDSEERREEPVNVVKPKAVRPKIAKRKLIETGSGEQGETEDKNLQHVAETLALADLEPATDTEENLQTSQLVSQSLRIVESTGLTPVKSSAPTDKEFWHNEWVKQRTEIEKLQKANTELTTKFNCLEYSVTCMWQDLSFLKQEVMGHRQQHQASFTESNVSHEDPVAGPSETPSTAFSPDAVSPSSSQSSVQDEDDEERRAYNGYVKSQIVAVASQSKNFKKATATIFRMLFTKEEVAGRSLFGQRSNTGISRPAIQDREKLAFLEKVIREKWPAVEVSSIRTVLRDNLKPSRLLTKNFSN